MRLTKEVKSGGAVLNPAAFPEYAAETLDREMRAFDPFKPLLICYSVRKNVLSKPIEELDLSFRSYSCLKRAGKATVGDIYDMTRPELMGVYGIGKRSLNEIERIMTKMGLPLKGE